jgi:hypothetical protein
MPGKVGEPSGPQRSGGRSLAGSSPPVTIEGPEGKSRDRQARRGWRVAPRSEIRRHRHSDAAPRTAMQPSHTGLGRARFFDFGVVLAGAGDV